MVYLLAVFEMNLFDLDCDCIVFKTDNKLLLNLAFYN